MMFMMKVLSSCKSKRGVCMAVMWLVLVVGVNWPSPTAAVAAPGYESYFMYYECDPHEETPHFMAGNDNLQGLAHDTGPPRWFVATTRCDVTDATRNGFIWSVPLEYDLGQVDGDEANVYGIMMSRDCKALYDQGFWHVGDLDCYQHFLVVPVECHAADGASKTHGIFLFDSQTLAFVGLATNAFIGWRDLGWVAVNPANGHIYTSPDNTVILMEYALSPDWNTVRSQPWPVSLELQLTNVIQLTNEGGQPMTEEFVNTQGGAFSETGSMFYFLSGNMATLFGTDGLHGFETDTWRRVLRSARCERNNPLCSVSTSCADFYYYWNCDCSFWEGYDCEEPEGIDVWDLDSFQPGETRYAGHGQLHVGMLDNDHSGCFGVGNQDDITIYHYTHSLYVNASFAGGDGRRDSPFRTVQQAYDLACNGMRIKISAGAYPENLTFTRPVILESRGQGPVVIGTASP